MEKIYIYGLYEKVNVIKYIGKTNNIKKRLKEHILDSIRNNKTMKHKWINKVISNGSTINIKIIEEIFDNKWEEREIHWIKSISGLTNLTDGGECGKIMIYDLSYSKCKKIIKDFNIKNRNDWFKFVNSDFYIKEIPKHPSSHYKLTKEWINWGDFLGTGRKQDNLIIDNYILYDESKKWVQKNYKIETQSEWKEYVKNDKIPLFIPNRPDRFYKNKNRGWISWGDFLGTGRISNQNKVFLSYEDAKKYAKNNKIKNITEWMKMERPQNIPSNPDKLYSEWISWGDFLGTGRKQDNLISKKYLSYEEAKKWVQKNLDFKSGTEYLKNSNKIPYFLPNHPEIFYNKKDRGWLGWKDYLSNKNYRKLKDYYDYNESKILVKKLNLNTSRSYLNYVRNNDTNLPKRPDLYYDNWISWNVFLDKVFIF